VKLRVNGGITPQLHAWLMQFLKEWPFMIWDGAFAAPLGMKVEQFARLPVTHASVKDAFQAMTRHDFQMAVRFNQQHNKEWLQNSGATEVSLHADLDRLLLCIKPVGDPLLAISSSDKKAESEPGISGSGSLPSMPSAVRPVPSLLGQCPEPVLAPSIRSVLRQSVFSGSVFNESRQESSTRSLRDAIGA